MITLDDLDTFHRFDPDGMLGRIAELPEQCRSAWIQAEELEIPIGYSRAEKVVVLGMGGSSIGGEILRTLAEQECIVPIFVNRDYNVPSFVDERTLVIASSYSGNTEETLSAFEASQERGALLIAITTGGKLARKAVELGIPLLTFSYRAEPRAAFGYSFIPLLVIMSKLGLVSDKSADLEEAIEVMEVLQEEVKETVPFSENPAKQLAMKLYGRLPLIYGAGHLREVARRWKTQFNENSKSWSFFEEMPELNHNAVEGVKLPEDLAEKIAVIMLTSPSYHPRTRFRFQVTREILDERGVACEVIEARGRSHLAQILSAIHFGDYTSFYLAMLYEVNPSPVGVISYIKRRLSDFKLDISK
jgi:glucose/mannose-6-phosphate isomerase